MTFNVIFDFLMSWVKNSNLILIQDRYQIESECWNQVFELNQKIELKYLSWVRRLILKLDLMISLSSTVAFILFILKKNDSLCLCMNYQNLNKITVKNHHSLSLISETLDRLSKIKQFTKLDLKMSIIVSEFNVKTSERWCFILIMITLNIWSCRLI